MPRLFKPLYRTSGPGSVFGTSNPFAKKLSGQDKASKLASKHSLSQNQELDEKNATKRCKSMGDDLLSWIDETLPTAFTAASANDTPQNTEERAKPAKTQSLNIKLNQEDISACAASFASFNDNGVHQALGLDTRCLHAFQVMGSNVCGEFTRLVRTLEARGVPLKHVAMNVPLNSYNSTATVGIKVVRSDHCKENRECVMIEPLLLESDSSLHAGESETSTIPVPKTLGARYSWKILSEMVNAIQREHAKCTLGHQGSELSALSVTLVTTDLALFCDINVEAHKKAVGSFLDRVAPFLKDGRVRSIDIVMAQTGQLGIHADQETSITQAGENMTWSSAREMHAFATARSVHAIQQELSTRRWDALEHVMASVDATLPSLNISFGVIDHCTAGYKLLSRQLSRTSFTGIPTSVKITIRLPELDDGTQCSVHFDGSYPIFPGNMRSTTAQCLWKDLHSLSGSTLSPVQSLLHSSIDASLIYGLPIRLTPAFEDDFSMNREMQVLTQSLFDFLEKGKLVLILSASSPDNIALNDTIFHHDGEQIFLLMPQDSPGSSTHVSTSGILFRYASAADLLLEAAPQRGEIFSDCDIVSQYADYIERAMESIMSSAYNPLVSRPGNDE